MAKVCETTLAYLLAAAARLSRSRLEINTEAVSTRVPSKPIKQYRSSVSLLQHIESNWIKGTFEGVYVFIGYK